MTQNHKLLLNDYLKDPTDIRLHIFANSVNKSFELNKKNIPALKSLINDYSLNPIPSRLKNIETYLEVNKSIPKANKSLAQLKTLTPKDLKEELSDTQKEMNTLANSINRLKSAKATPQSLDKISELEVKLNELKTSKGDFDRTDMEKILNKNWMDNVLGILGHWDDSNSIAYKLVNGIGPRIEIKTGMPLAPVLEALEFFSNTKFRHLWWNQTNKGYGSQSTGFTEMTILTLANSGLSPIKENGVSTDIRSGQEINSNVNFGSISIPGIGQTIGVTYKK